MAKDYAKSFYNSVSWVKCRTGYMQSVNYVCENCQGVGEICHHKEHMTPNNIHDPDITLNWDNLQSLCIECHNKVHGNNQVISDGLVFDTDGNLVSTQSIRQLKGQVKVIMGYPASGKTTYVRQTMGTHDIVLDLDRIIEALTFKDGHNRQDNSLYAVRIANDMMIEAIDNISSDRYKFDTLYLIRTRLKDEDYDTLEAINAKFYWIGTSKEVCRERLIKQNRNEVIKIIDDCELFYNKYKDSMGIIRT